MRGCTFLALPINTFIATYEITPSAIPSEIEYINGIAISATNAGAESAISSKLILVILESIIRPTIISAGAVAKDGIARKIGDKNSDKPNKTALVTDVRPFCRQALHQMSFQQKLLQ